MTELSAYVTANEIHRALAADAPFPTIQAAMGVARNHVERITRDALKMEVLGDLQAMFDLHVMMYGPLPEKARLFQIDPWLEPLEAQLEPYFEARKDKVTMSWLGTVDARAPKSADEVLRLAESYAQVAYEVITWYYDHDEQQGRPKTPAQVLSAVGIVRADLEGYVDASAPAPTPTKGTVTMYDTTALITELHNNAAMFGMAGPALQAVLDNASDDDAGLGASGLAALMVAADVPAKHATLVGLRKQYGLPQLTVMVQSGVMPLGAPAVAAAPAPVTVQPMPPAALDMSAFMGTVATPAPAEAALDMSAFMGAPTQASAPVVPAVQTGSAPEKKGKGKAKEPAAPEAGVFPGELLSAIRDATNAKSEELGEVVGVSRASFDNYCKGKGKLHITDEAKQRLTEKLNGQLASIAAALSQLEAL